MSMSQHDLKKVLIDKNDFHNFDCNFLCENNNFRRFIVITRSRTGSNLLISLLNSHPNIVAKGEILKRLDNTDYKSILKDAFCKIEDNIQAAGFKFFYYHPTDDNYGAVCNDIISMKDIYVIHLKRKNILRTLLSRKKATINAVWVDRSDEALNSIDKDIAVRFTTNELRRGFEQTRKWEDDTDYNFRNHPMLDISYEDLVNDRFCTFSKILDFLGVQFVEPSTELKKQSSKSIRESITNYDELKVAFSNSVWSHFFEE